MIDETVYSPYTYLIGWSKENLWYYGSRYAKKSNILYKSGAHPDDLWNTYFTSSSKVQELRLRLGEPDVIKVRRVFLDEELTRKWEETVLKRMKVLNDDRWINRTDSPGIPSSAITKSNKSRECTIETRKNNSKSNRDAWVLKKIQNPHYVGNRKGLVKLKNIKTGKIAEFIVGTYDKDEWVHLTCDKIYCTPFGNFTGPKNVPDELKRIMSYPTMLSMCTSDATLTIKHINPSNFLTTEDLGKTYKDLGFYNIKI